MLKSSNCIWVLFLLLCIAGCLFWESEQINNKQYNDIGRPIHCLKVLKRHIFFIFLKQEQLKIILLGLLFFFLFLLKHLWIFYLTNFTALLFGKHFFLKNTFVFFLLNKLYLISKKIYSNSISIYFLSKTKLYNFKNFKQF